MAPLSMGYRSSHAVASLFAAQPQASQHRDAQAWALTTDAAVRPLRAGFAADLTRPSAWVRSHIYVPSPHAQWDVSPTGPNRPTTSWPAALGAAVLGAACCVVRIVGVILALVAVGPMYALCRLATRAWTHGATPTAFAWLNNPSQSAQALEKRITCDLRDEEARLAKSEAVHGPQPACHAQFFKDLARDAQVDLTDAWGVIHALAVSSEGEEKSHKAMAFITHELAQLTDGDARWQRQVTYLASQNIPIALLLTAQAGAGVRRLNDVVYQPGQPAAAMPLSMLWNNRSRMTFALSREMDPQTQRRAVRVACTLTWDSDAVRAYATKYAQLHGAETGQVHQAPAHPQGMQVSVAMRVTQPQSENTGLLGLSDPEVSVLYVNWTATPSA